jgi:hypothetical protein
VSLSTFNELKADIADFLNRDDLDTVIPKFIKLAEADMNRKLRHWRMERRSNATVDTRYTSLPQDFIDAVRLQITSPGGVQRLELISNSELMDKRAVSDIAGKPRFYVINDGTIEMYPTPDQDYTLEMVYISSLPDLETNSTNWLLTYHPDCYLYGALLHSAPYLQEDPRTQTWAALYKNTVDGINLEDDKAKTSGAGHRMRIRSF